VKTDPALERYLQDAVSWDIDRLAQTKRSERTAWLIAAAGWVCAVAGAVSIAFLTPLKGVEPFVIRVDNATGIVDVVPVFTGHVSMEQAVTRYFLTHYITICERFNLVTAESDYQECGAFHTAQRNQAWYALWNTTNPRSPLNVHKDGSTVHVDVESVSFFRRSNGVEDLAQVRYRKSDRPIGGAAEHTTHWIATIQYAYASPSKDAAIRRWNPLGFKVVEVGSEPEVLTTPAGSSTASFAGSVP
jgi:type IV secretion system protein VirB8